MPRRARIIASGIPVHIIQRGNNRQACFFADEDYLFYLACLAEYAKIAGCQIHAFVLMTNHVHLLLTPGKKESAGILMKLLGQRYAQYINRKYKRSGTLWEGRFRSCIIQKEEYLFACQQYIEMNPVRAGIVNRPDAYRWSSYQANGLGKHIDFLRQSSLYQGLGRTDEERQASYRELFRHELEPGEIDKIRKATNGNFALGNNRFQKEVGEMLGRRVVPGKPGRPREQKRTTD